MVAPMTSFLIFEVNSFKVVTIIILILAKTMLETVLKLAFEEQISTSVKFSFSMETVVLPLTLILEVLIKQKDPKSFPESSLKVAFIVVSILIVCFALAMRVASFPATHIFCDIIVLLRLIVEPTLSMKHPSSELSLIARSICKLIDSLPILLIVHPVSLIHIA